MSIFKNAQRLLQRELQAYQIEKEILEKKLTNKEITEGKKQENRRKRLRDLKKRLIPGTKKDLKAVSW